MKNLKPDYIRAYLREHPDADDNEIAIHHATPAITVRAIRKKWDIPLANERTGPRGENASPNSRGGAPRFAGITEQQPVAPWKEPPVSFPQMTVELNREIIELYRRLEPSMGPRYTRHGPYGLIPYLRDTDHEKALKLKQKDAAIDRLQSEVASLKSSNLYRRIEQAEGSLRAARTEIDRVNAVHKAEASEVEQAARTNRALRDDLAMARADATRERNRALGFEQEIARLRRQAEAKETQHLEDEDRLQFVVRAGGKILDQEVAKARNEGKGLGRAETEEFYRGLFGQPEIDARIAEKRAREAGTSNLNNLVDAYVRRQVAWASEARDDLVENGIKKARIGPSRGLQTARAVGLKIPESA